MICFTSASAHYASQTILNSDWYARAVLAWLECLSDDPVSRAVCLVLVRPFMPLGDRSAATIWLTGQFESMRPVSFGIACEARGASNRLKSLNHLMACAAYVGCKKQRQEHCKPQKGREMISCRDMAHQSESLPISGFTPGFTSTM